MRSFFLIFTFLACIQQVLASGETEFSRREHKRYTEFVEKAAKMNEATYNKAVDAGVGAFHNHSDRVANDAEWKVAAEWCAQDTARWIEQTHGLGSFATFRTALQTDATSKGLTYSHNQKVMLLAQCTIFDEVMKFKHTLFDIINPLFTASKVQDGASILVKYMRAFFAKKFDDALSKAPVINQRTMDQFEEDRVVTRFREGAFEFTTNGTHMFMHVKAPYIKDDTHQQHFIVSKDGTLGRLPYEGSIRTFITQFEAGCERQAHWIRFLGKEDMLYLNDSKNFLTYPANEQLRNENNAALEALRDATVMYGRDLISTEQGGTDIDYHQTYNATAVFADGKRKNLRFHALMASLDALKGKRFNRTIGPARGRQFHKAAFSKLGIPSDDKTLTPDDEDDHDTVQFSDENGQLLPNAF